jgi:hypothetical protein
MKSKALYGLYRLRVYVHVNGWRRLGLCHRTIGLRIQHVLYGKYGVYLIVCLNEVIENCASTFFSTPRQQLIIVYSWII